MLTRMQHPRSIKFDFSGRGTPTVGGQIHFAPLGMDDTLSIMVDKPIPADALCEFCPFTDKIIVYNSLDSLAGARMVYGGHSISDSLPIEPSHSFGTCSGGIHGWSIIEGLNPVSDLFVLFGSRLECGK